MATGHFLTNRGRLLLAQGAWDDEGGTDWRVVLVKVQPAGLDTQAETNLINLLTAMFSGGATECDFTNYARKTLTRTVAVEDDTNHRVNMDAADVVWSAAGGATNNTVYGAIIYEEGGGTDATRPVISVDWFATPVTTNGGNLTYAITDLYRAS